MSQFKLQSEYVLSDVQSRATEELSADLEKGNRNNVLLGVTGSGKTFTMANIINKLNRPALIMAHNKTLASQIYSEMLEYFPSNAVEYFVSYYDYYQPEAYLAAQDVYIEKDARINEKIDLLRHSATRSLLERKDVIVVASVSCIYGIGAPELYFQMSLLLEKGMKIRRNELLEQFVSLQYERNDIEFERGSFRVRGHVIDIYPSHLKELALRIEFFGDKIDKIYEFEVISGKKTNTLDKIRVYANNHYVTPRNTIEQAIKFIKAEMQDRVKYFKSIGKLIEAERIYKKTVYDMEMMRITGSCKGIENYSRYLSGKKAGDAPSVLFDYLSKEGLLFVDESHVAVPQIKGMWGGDRSRKENLVEYGFRLPSALDNRPLTFEEWDKKRPNTVFVSATPGKFELNMSERVVEQIVRPTGVLDPECELRPAESQVDDLLNEISKVVKAGGRVLVTTLTKKMAVELSSYLEDLNIHSVYLHSDVETLERVEIIQDLRLGKYDVLVGVNLLREGLDIPECTLVAILDADKTGFLRSETALIQTVGRAARNIGGRAILYCDNMTEAIRVALAETKRRRRIQEHYNQEHNITPRSIKKKLTKLVFATESKDKNKESKIKGEDLAILEKEMREAANDLDFERAAKLRDRIKKIKGL